MSPTFIPCRLVSFLPSVTAVLLSIGFASRVDAQSTLANPFGSLPANAWSATGDPDQTLTPTARLATVKNLGIPYIRTAFSHIDTDYDFTAGTWKSGKTGAWDNYVTYAQGGCKVLLNFNWQGSANGGLGSVFPTGTDLSHYLLALGNVLDDMNGITGAATKLPVVLVPENEEANASYYDFSVNRENYLDQLAGAIPIAHTRGIKITNAGLTEVPFNLYVWNYYYNVIHDTTKATNFYNAALGPGFFTTYPTLTSTNQSKLDIAKTLIDGTVNHPGYKDLAIDYLNLHWYHAPGGVIADELATFEEAAGVLAGITGKTVISNEMGARITAFGQSLPANTITSMMTSFHQTLMMPYVVWYSGPGPAPGPYPVALSDTNGNLTTEGNEFRSYVTTHFDNVFTNTYWHAGSPSVALTLNSSPATLVVGSGSQNFTTTIAAGATQKWIYQWYKLGAVTATRTTAATSATSDTFSTAATGTYYCFVTNPAGAVLTTDAMLWNRVKIGGDSSPNATYSSGTYTVNGLGGSIGNTSDVCQFVQQAAGNARVLIARVATSSANGKSGLMLRNGTAANAAYVFIGLGNGNAETRFQTRSTAGGGTTNSVASVTATWLKLEADGANVSCFYSTSGSNNPPTSWTPLGGTTTVSYATPLIGLAVAGTSGAQTTATFTKVTVD